VKELKSDTARIGIEGATLLFDASVGNTVKVPLSAFTHTFSHYHSTRHLEEN